MQRIVFVSRATAQAMAARLGWSVISISDPDEGPAQLAEGWYGVLRLEFMDAEEGSVHGPLFDEAMADDVLTHAEQALEAGRSLLVHCHAGVSRSAAVAMALGEFHGLPVFSGDVPLSPRYALHNKHVYRLMHRAMAGY